ncbi:MAG: Maf family protein, partial [Clostridia bacterium]|nr:Maf family protein [Clostridia bacterium]
MKYILASASPRRRELLSQVVKSFEAIPAQAEEKVNLAMFPEKMACALAEHKCDEVFESHTDATVIGCDTVVYFEGEILGKPKTKAEAAETLKRLSGKTHYVITGVCVRNKY